MKNDKYYSIKITGGGTMEEIMTGLKSVSEIGVDSIATVIETRGEYELETPTLMIELFEDAATFEELAAWEEEEERRRTAAAANAPDLELEKLEGGTGL